MVTMFSIILWLAAFATGTVASINAGPYQTLYYWYGYQAEIEAFGKPEYMATGCVGSGPGKTCNFREFLAYIADFKSPKANRNYEVGIEWETLDPNKMADAAQRLYDIQYPSRALANKIVKFAGKTLSDIIEEREIALSKHHQGPME